MKPYFVKTPKIIQSIFSNYTWKIASHKKEIYLTFDDGPIPKITPWVLNTLEKYNAKATFFCVGDNIKKHPEVFKEIILQNHAIGNHTFNHLQGWKTNTYEYLQNIEKTENVIKRLKIEGRRQKTEDGSLKTDEKPATNNQQPTTSNLFRPPYGKIKSKQAKALQNKGYHIIMWDVLSADFDQKISPEKCYQNVIKNAQSGSIIVFHDNEKAFKNLEYTLPKVLEYFTKKGFVFKAL